MITPKSWKEALELICKGEEIDISKLSFPKLNVSDIVNVQPLTTPTDKFVLRYNIK